MMSRQEAVAIAHELLDTDQKSFIVSHVLLKQLTAQATAKINAHNSATEIAYRTNVRTLKEKILELEAQVRRLEEGRRSNG